MRILQVNSTIDPVLGGGAAARTVQVSRGLVDEGQQCTLLTIDRGITDIVTADLSGVDVIALPCLNKRFGVPLVSYSRIKRIVASVDIVQLMNHWSILNALVCRAAVSLKKPYIVCPVGALPIYGRSKLFKRAYNFVVGDNIVKNASAHMAATVSELDHFSRAGVPAGCVSVLPNGVGVVGWKNGDPEAFRRKYGLPVGQFILFLGRLNDIKGPDLLLKAYYEEKRIRESFCLVFAGPDFGMQDYLKSMVDKYGLTNRVRFLGYISEIERWDAYSAANLVVVPSRQDALPLVILEAGMSGTPLLATDRCGLSSEIDAVKMVPPTVQGLRSGLVEMLCDVVQSQAMARQFQSYVRDNYDWKIICRGHVDLYTKVLQGKLL